MDVRVDKWLWAVRVFKTRSKAAEACKKGRVLIEGHTVKASRIIKVGETISVKRNPITFAYKVLRLTQNRLGAKLVPDYMLQVTSADQLELLELMRIDQRTGYRDRGTGRPTKKERRSIDDFQDQTPHFIEEEEDVDKLSLFHTGLDTDFDVDEIWNDDDELSNDSIDDNDWDDFV